MAVSLRPYLLTHLVLVATTIAFVWELEDAGPVKHSLSFRGSPPVAFEGEMNKQN